MNPHTTLISAADLHGLIASSNPATETDAGRNSRLCILDCRAQLGDPDAGPAAWVAGHIEGSVHANLDHALAAPAHSLADGRGGRHPLPDREKLAQQCGVWGIKATTQVVAYDDAGGAYAARAWWLLRWLGHEAVAVLDGGLAAWLELTDGRLTTDAAEPEQTRFVSRNPLTRIATLDEVRSVVSEAGSTPAVLLDARARQRYAGEQEPIDPVAGHIPGAECFPHSENLAANGRFKSPTELAARFASVGDREAICYCGSGVTATHNILALRHAGLGEASLYVGSWSEWCAIPDLPRG